MDTASASSLVCYILIWLLTAILVAMYLAEIRPQERRFTKPRWIRALMIFLGPFTVAIACVLTLIMLLPALGGEARKLWLRVMDEPVPVPDLATIDIGDIDFGGEVEPET